MIAVTSLNSSEVFWSPLTAPSLAGGAEAGLACSIRMTVAGHSKSLGALLASILTIRRVA